MQSENGPLISSAACSENYLTRQDIMKFPFPYKLWLVVNLDFCDFLRWNRDGTVILLDLVALEEYLNLARSIFVIKNVSTFLQHLADFQFDRLNAQPEAEEDLLLQYKNENFQRHRLDLLAKIRRRLYQTPEGVLMGGPPPKVTGVLAADSAATAGPTNDQAALQQRLSQRMMGDLCFMSHGGMSDIQKKRLRFQTIVNFQNETRILQAKLRASDEHAANMAAAQPPTRRHKSEASNGRHVAGSAGAGAGAGGACLPREAEEEQIIELPVELFENPHDSVLQLGDDFRPEYAGYYGNCSKEQILHFFGDYLPMYEDGSMEVKKIVAEVSNSSMAPYNNSNNNNSHLSEFMLTPNMPSTEPFNMQTSTPIQTRADHQLHHHMQQQQQHHLSDLNLSSTLQPIFKTDEDELHEQQQQQQQQQHLQLANNNNSRHIDPEADIAMEEFLHFKRHSPDNAGAAAAAAGVGGAATVLVGAQPPEAHNHLQPLAAGGEGDNSNDSLSVGIANSNLEGGSLGCRDYPQMPAAVKLEITEDHDTENEANFRNFFSQYRASLNLLYKEN